MNERERYFAKRINSIEGEGNLIQDLISLTSLGVVDWQRTDIDSYTTRWQNQRILLFGPEEAKLRNRRFMDGLSDSNKVEMQRVDKAVDEIKVTLSDVHEFAGTVEIKTMRYVEQVSGNDAERLFTLVSGLMADEPIVKEINKTKVRVLIGLGTLSAAALYLRMKSQKKKKLP